MVMTEEERKELDKAMVILVEFNRADISYRICEDGSFEFYSNKDYDRVQEIIKEIENKK